MAALLALMALQWRLIRYLLCRIVIHHYERYRIFDIISLYYTHNRGSIELNVSIIGCAMMLECGIDLYVQPFISFNIRF